MFDKSQNYFLYARKSSESEDKQTASIESQMKELTSLAKSENLNIVRVFSESKSAKAPGRQQFNLMIKAIENGEASGIICWKLDRLARNPIDGGKVSWLLQQGVISHIRTFERSFYPADNVLMMSVEFGMSNQFIRDLSVNTKRGLRKKATDGHFPTYAPLGYIHDPLVPKGKKYIIADPERFHVIQKARKFIARGTKSPLGALEWALENGLTTRYGNKVAQSSWYHQLKNPFYYGEYEYPRDSGEWFLGKHPAMITKDEYKKIQEVLNSNYRSRSSYLRHLFNGFVRCGECGASITTEVKRKTLASSKLEVYVLCHCTKRKNPECSQRSAHQEELENQFRKILDSFVIPESFGRWILKYLRLQNNQRAEAEKNIIEDQRKRYDSCTTRINRLIDMATDGLLTTEEFAERKRALLTEKQELQELLADSDKNVSQKIKAAEDLIDFASSAKQKFESKDLEKRREVLQLLGTFLILKDGVLECALPKKLLVFQKKPKTKRPLNLEGSSSSNNSSWLPTPVQNHQGQKQSNREENETNGTV